jgi:hypothetical protein
MIAGAGSVIVSIVVGAVLVLLVLGILVSRFVWRR